jgi:hypothetical protein
MYTLENLKEIGFKPEFLRDGTWYTYYMKDYNQLDRVFKVFGLNNYFPIDEIPEFCIVAKSDMTQFQYCDKNCEFAEDKLDRVDFEKAVKVL